MGRAMDVSYFESRTDADALSTPLLLKSKLHKRQKEGAVELYCEAVNYFLEKYLTSDVIAEPDADMRHFLNR